MSQAMDLIDEARSDRDIANSHAAQWQYLATLLFLQRGDTELVLPPDARDIEFYYLEANEIDDDLVIRLREGDPNA